MGLTEVCNMAIRHCAISKEIQDIETDVSAEAKACRRFHEPARLSMLRSLNWPFATAFQTLALVTERDVDDSHPTDDYRFAYAEPAHCLKARRIVSGTIPDTRASRIVFRQAYAAAQQVILTDKEGAILEYTLDVDDPNRWPPDFMISYSFLLGIYIAPSLVSGNFLNVQQSIKAGYQMEIGKSSASAFNEEQAPVDALPEMLSVRG